MQDPLSASILNWEKNVLEIIFEKLNPIFMIYLPKIDKASYTIRRWRIIYF